jgi:hypothetical protein
MRVEWGPDLGKAVGFRFPYIPIYDGWVAILPHREGGPLELLVALEKETVSRLKEDEEWRRFAKWYA